MNKYKVLAMISATAGKKWRVWCNRDALLPAAFG